MFLNKIKYDINFIQNQFFIMNQTLYKLFSPKYFVDGAISLSYGSNDQLFGSFNYRTLHIAGHYLIDFILTHSIGIYIYKTLIISI